MKCGNCHQPHETVTEVRSCYGQTSQPDHSSSARQFGAPATEKQRDFLSKLLKERGQDQLGPKDHNMTKQQASAMIDSLLNTPKPASQPKAVAPSQVTRVSEHYAMIPEGYYATKSATGHNDLDFWKVTRPTQGKWKGYLFVNRIIGGRSATPVKGSTKMQALEAIKTASPETAMALYGQTLGYCGRCGRSLTDETSRALGIGPVCRNK